MSIRISKSKFCAGVQCPKRLWCQVHKPELAAQPSAAAEAIIQQGREVGMIARHLFPGGVEVGCEHGLGQAIRATRELLANPEIPAIFEGVFEHWNVLAKVDIVYRRRDGFRLIEVKSTTDVKEEHEHDLGIQYRVLHRSGLNVGSACLAHVNRGYIYPGGEIDPRRFFRIRNLTRRVQRLQPKLAFQLRSEFTVLGMAQPPDVKPGKHCTDPITCEFYDHCNPPRANDHIGFLPRIHASAVEELEQMGIESVHDVPDDFELTEPQRRAATCVRTAEPWFDRDGLKAQLATLNYPVAYIDFETINPAIPRFAGTSPYQQIPFQWSAHIQQRPCAEPEHFEYLASDSSDPRREFVMALLAVLPKTGSIVVYNQRFESARLDELAAAVPEFAETVKNIQSRLWDLLPIIRSHVYHPKFCGSYSLKSVVPALVPGLSYSDMEIADGQAAGLAWEALVHGSLGCSERDRIRKALLDYCALDTLALTRLVDTLQCFSRN